MITIRHILFAATAMLALCGPALAGDVQIYSTGTNDTLGFRMKNTSDKMRYSVNVEIKRINPKSGDTISSRTDQHTLDPLADLYLGPAFQQGAKVSYSIASIRLVPSPTPPTAKRDNSLPAPYPFTFGGK